MCAVRTGTRPLRSPGLATTAALLGLLALCRLPACVADVEFRADVDTDVLTTEDLLYLTVSLSTSGAGASGEPQLASSAGFAVSGRPSQSVSYSVVGTRISKRSQYVFALRPLRSGVLSTPTATVTVAGTEYRTEPIKVQVNPGSGGGAAPSSGGVPDTGASSPSAPDGAPFEGTPACAIVCEVDDKTPYRGQQVILTAELYRSQYVDAKLEPGAPAGGFIIEELQTGRRTSDWVSINGMPYEHASFEWALMPLETGKQEVTAPVILKETGGQGREFVGNSITLDVRPLPPNPGGGAAAVGTFAVRLSVEKSQVKAGEGVTATVRIDGIGDVSPVSRPALEVPQWCKVYDSAENRKTETRPYGGRQAIGGTATFDYLLVPRRAGSLAIGPVQFVYFDPGEGRYVTAPSEAALVTVTPGDVIQEPSEDAKTSALHHIKTSRPRLQARPVVLFGPVPGVVVGACVLLVLWAAATRVRDNRRRSAPDLALAHGAARAAHRALARADRAPDAEFHLRVEAAVTQYAADRFGLPLSGLTAEQMRDGLLARGVDPGAAEAAREILLACHASRYAPGMLEATSRQRIQQAAGEVILLCERGGGRSDEEQ